MNKETRPLLKYLYSLKKADRIAARELIACECGVSRCVVKNWAIERTDPPLAVKKLINDIFDTEVYKL